MTARPAMPCRPRRPPTATSSKGPFDIEDFDDAATAAVGRLDLGSVLIPMPENGQVQVELNEAGAPNAVWVITPNGRFTVAAYAAPKSAGLWREVAAELAEALRKDTPNVSIETGPWGREVVGMSEGAVRFIGIDGYRWMIRCVVNGPRDTFAALAAEARKALVDTVVRRDDTPLPVRTPLPVQLPEPMLARLRAPPPNRRPPRSFSRPVNRVRRPRRRPRHRSRRCRRNPGRPGRAPRPGFGDAAVPRGDRRLAEPSEVSQRRQARRARPARRGPPRCRRA